MKKQIALRLDETRHGLIVYISESLGLSIQAYLEEMVSERLHRDFWLVNQAVDVAAKKYAGTPVVPAKRKKS
jgi:hypothetical protein